MITKLIGLISICIFFQICVKRDGLKIVLWKLVVLATMALFGFIIFSKSIYLVFLCLLLGAYTDSISETVYSMVSYMVGGYELIIYCFNFSVTEGCLIPLVVIIMAIIIYSYVFRLLGQGDADILIVCALMCANIGVSPIGFILFLVISASAVFLIIQSIKSVKRREFIRYGAFVPSLLIAFCLMFII